MHKSANIAAAEWQRGWKVTIAAAMGMALASLVAYIPLRVIAALMFVSVGKYPVFEQPDKGEKP